MRIKEENSFICTLNVVKQFLVEGNEKYIEHTITMSNQPIDKAWEIHKS